MKLIVIDTETSDLPEQGGSMIELAWISLLIDPTMNKWTARASYENYIQYGGPIHPRAQASNHINPACLKAERGAVTRERAVMDLLNEVEPDSFLVAHNSDFDSKFLPELINPWICTYRVSKHIWPDAPGHSNQVLRYWLEVDPDLSVATTIKYRAPHQALYDVATTVEILKKMLERHSPAELHQMTGAPRLLRFIEFGKHKGTEFKDIPRDYLVWLRGQSNLDRDLKYTLDSILQPGVVS